MAASVPAWADGLREGVVLVEEGRVVYLNRPAARLLEVDRDRVVGLPLIAVLRDHRLERVVLEGRPVEVATRGRLVRAAPLPGGLTLADVSELRAAQEGARELLAVLSHELRTPVAAIRSTLEALRYELPEAQRERFLERAASECERLVRLLEDLTVDVVPPKARRVPLLEVVQRARAVLQPTLVRHGVRLDAELPAVDLWVDEDKLLQVLVNLVENAAIHGPDGEAVRLTAEPERGRPQLLRLCVRDQGTPLDPAIVEELFRPHSRGRSAKARGTGLGLYIVRSIAERWRGDAWGRPLAEGNEFGVTVPREPLEGPPGGRSERRA